MEKRTKILSAFIIIIIFITATLAIYYHTLQTTNQLPSGEPSDWQITVTGDVMQQRTWTLKEISKMPLTSVNTVINGENATYIGVSLLEFCNQSGMLWDAGPIDIIGANGQSVTLNVFQAWNSTAYPRYQINNRIILAFVKNGQWMTNETGGPVELITPWFGEQYQIESVADLNIGLWTVSISGAVSNPLTFTGENMTNFQERTIESEFAPGDSPQVTANWTGLSMLGLLQVSNMSNKATMITVVAIDGYEENFTIQQIKDSQMLIGFQENYTYLPLSQGGPFRLFLPVNEYKWGYRWAKFVCQVIVS
ncbi:MAG: molybdopterin-dependent oxidoreductase [Nitrososphaeria archaeon]|jgi:DMSO/TMAO reductase YedYZ molybdopterin-dependent catalytic subunit